MTIEEFKSNLVNQDIKISDADFETIHTVYQYHPLAATKKDIAKLFEIGGMLLIKDMFVRAVQIGKAEREMLHAKRIFEEANERYQALKK
jgi:hypothetical protein